MKRYKPLLYEIDAPADGLTSSDIPQNVRPENVKKVIKIGSVAKVDSASFEEDELWNIDDKDSVLDTDTIERQKDKKKLISKVK